MLIFAPHRFKCCNLHDQKHFSLIMESWLLRNVGFYRSFLPFYIIRSILEIVSSGTDYPEQPGKLTTNTRSARDKRWVPEKDTHNVSGSICPRRLKCLCFASILFFFFLFFFGRFRRIPIGSIWKPSLSVKKKWGQIATEKYF